MKLLRLRQKVPRLVMTRYQDFSLSNKITAMVESNRTNLHFFPDSLNPPLSPSAV